MWESTLLFPDYIEMLEHLQQFRPNVGVYIGVPPGIAAVSSLMLPHAPSLVFLLSLSLHLSAFSHLSDILVECEIDIHWVMLSLR